MMGFHCVAAVLIGGAYRKECENIPCHHWNFFVPGDIGSSVASGQ